MSAERSFHLIIRGRVQGVGYRAWAQAMARQHGLSGWVRNRLDGTVEAVIAGPEDAVAAMIEACREGPPAARVDAIEVSEAAGANRPGFHLAETA